ncbi:hypothetical protein BaRGS_00017348 [Batillaria attramentaria]|uniref:Uncharacterized protein n=1 Tax=Batillaria attramentaria TaxID=370345 RepID=A0ABD0KWD2_9CAEN
MRNLAEFYFDDLSCVFKRDVNMRSGRGRWSSAAHVLSIRPETSSQSCETKLDLGRAIWDDFARKFLFCWADQWHQ